MDKVQNKSLIAALNWACVRELPPVDDKENVWIFALALVAKKDGSKGYVALTKDKNGESRIVKDFGSTSMIVKVEEIYPYLYLDPTYIPQFGDKKKEERVKWLKLTDPDGGDYDAMSLKELNKAILNRAIQNHINATKQEQ